MQSSSKNSMSERQSSLEDGLPSIAYSFNGYHGDYLSIPVALAAVYHPRNVYCVLVDGSFTAPEVDTLHRLILEAVQKRHPDLSICDEADTVAACIVSRIFVHAGDFSVTWGGISEPLSTFDAMQKLVELDDHWSFFVNLTPLDYPLASQDDISELLKHEKGLTFMGTHASSIDVAEGRFRDRWRQMHFDPSLIKKREDGKKEQRQKMLRLSSTLPDSISDSPLLRVYQSEAYGVFDRAFVLHALKSPLTHRVIALLSNGFASSEQLLATILGNSKEFGHCPSSLRMNNVAAGPDIDLKNPVDKEVQHSIEALAESGLLFARKFATVTCGNDSSDEYCQNAYNNELYRSSVWERLVKTPTSESSSEKNNSQLQEVWRTAAKARFKSMEKSCYRPEKLAAN